MLANPQHVRQTYIYTNCAQAEWHSPWKRKEEALKINFTCCKGKLILHNLLISNRCKPPCERPPCHLVAITIQRQLQQQRSASFSSRQQKIQQQTTANSADAATADSGPSPAAEQQVKMFSFFSSSSPSNDNNMNNTSTVETKTHQQQRSDHTTTISK